MSANGSNTVPFWRIGAALYKRTSPLLKLIVKAKSSLATTLIIYFLPLTKYSFIAKNKQINYSYLHL